MSKIQVELSKFLFLWKERGKSCVNAKCTSEWLASAEFQMLGRMVRTSVSHPITRISGISLGNKILNFDKFNRV